VRAGLFVGYRKTSKILGLKFNPNPTDNGTNNTAGRSTLGLDRRCNRDRCHRSSRGLVLDAEKVEIENISGEKERRINAA
jgi:hypothetical protein